MALLSGATAPVTRPEVAFELSVLFCARPQHSLAGRRVFLADAANSPRGSDECHSARTENRPEFITLKTFSS
jgi:hypothetical protein